MDRNYFPYGIQQCAFDWTYNWYNWEKLKFTPPNMDNMGKLFATFFAFAPAHKTT